MIVAQQDRDRAALGELDLTQFLADDRGARLELRLDDLQLAALELRQVEQVVNGDLVLDDA